MRKVTWQNLNLPHVGSSNSMSTSRYLACYKRNGLLLVSLFAQFQNWLHTRNVGKKKQESWGTYVSLTVWFHKRTENQYGSREVGCICKIFRLACAHILPHAFCFDWKTMFARYHPLLFLLVCYPGICLLSAGCWPPSVCRGSVDCLLTVCWPCWPSVDCWPSVVRMYLPVDELGLSPKDSPMTVKH